MDIGVAFLPLRGKLYALNNRALRQSIFYSPFNTLLETTDPPPFPLKAILSPLRPSFHPSHS